MTETDNGARYAVCPNCGYIEDWALLSRMRCNVPCPRCDHPDAFGPNVYESGFDGYTWAEARHNFFTGMDYSRRLGNES